MLKKVVAIMLTLSVLFSVPTISYAAEPSISSDAAILIDANTGQILFEKNIHEPMYPASTTKIMTGILALESGKLDDIVTVDNKTPYEISGSHIALEPGEIISFNDLLHALLIESANDAAAVIAKHISGSTSEFAKLMNDKAKEVGAKNTHFVNPHGLHNKEHTTTAYDLAKIAQYAMKNDDFRSLVKKYKYTINETNKKDVKRYLKSSNKMLYATGTNNKINVNGRSVDIKYAGSNGVKTGYTPEAQNCLVTSAVRGNQELISVVLHATGKNVYIDTHKLLDYGFDNFESKQLAFKNEFIQNIDIERGDKTFIPLIVGQTVFATLSNETENNINKTIKLQDNITTPVSNGQVLGNIEYTLDDEVIGTANLISAVDVNLKGIYQVVNTSTKGSLLEKWWLWLIIIFILWKLYIQYRRTKRKIRRRKIKRSQQLNFNKKSRKI